MPRSGCDFALFWFHIVVGLGGGEEGRGKEGIKGGEGERRWRRDER